MTSRATRAQDEAPRRRACAELMAALLGCSVLSAMVIAGSTAASAQPATSNASGETREIVILRDQLINTPAVSVARRSAARSEQDALLAALPGPTPPHVRHFSVGNAFAATVTPMQLAWLRAQPAVGSVIADSRVIVPAASAAKAKTPQRTRTPSVRRSSQHGWEDGTLCPANPAKPLLEPEALTAIRATNPTGHGGAQRIVDGHGVKVAVIADGLDPNAPDFRRADGTSAIVDYQDFSGEGPTGAWGVESFGDASSIAAQGRVVHDLSKYVNPAHALPAGCNVVVRGVAPGASVVALKVLSDGEHATYAITSNVLQAIDYAVSTDHVDVINESIGIAAYPDAGSRDAVELFNDQAVRAGIAVTAATGDAGSTGTIGSPAADPLIISAGASTTQRLALQAGVVGTSLSNGHWRNGQIAAFSSGGVTQSATTPTLVAPGDSGWAVCTDSTVEVGCTDLNGAPSSIVAFGGASEAAPLTAGAIALVIEAYRNTHHGHSPSPALIKQLLTSTARDLGAPSDEQGAGQLDALAAVDAAMAVGRTSHLTRAGDVNDSAGVVASVNQIANVGAPGSTATDRVRFTNLSARPKTVAPVLRALAPVGHPQQLSASLTATSPTLTDPYGNPAQYTVEHFDVRPHVARFAVALAYRSADTTTPGGPPLPILLGAPQVTATLLDPSGDYIVSSRPQGGGNSGDYGNIAVARPTPGRWTMVLSTKPGYVTLFGITIPTAAYVGDVSIAVTSQRWHVTGTAQPARVRLAPGRTGTVVVRHQLPTQSGDSVATLDPRVAGQSATIPVVQRVLIPFERGVGRFTGTISGGNGRPGSAAQTLTYAFDVTGHHADLDLDTHFAFPGPGSLLNVILIDPNEQTYSVNNLPPEVVLFNLTSYDKNVAEYVHDPLPGRWRLVVVVSSPVVGDALSVPFSGRLRYDHVTVGHAGVPNNARTTWRAGSTHTVEVSYTNTSTAPMQIVVDPRTQQRSIVDLGRQTALLPLDAASFLSAVDYVIPPLTSAFTASVDATQPALTQITGPTAFAYLGGPTVTGSIAPLANGHSVSSATVSTASGSLSIGEWNVLPGQAGPYGDGGAPSGTAQIDVQAFTNGFATDVSSPTGDPYQPSSTPGAGPSAPLLVAPGQTVATSVTFTVTAPPGTTVRGLLNLVSPGQATLFSKLVFVGVGTTGVLAAQVPFTYTVAKP